MSQWSNVYIYIHVFGIQTNLKSSQLDIKTHLVFLVHQSEMAPKRLLMCVWTKYIFCQRKTASVYEVPRYKDDIVVKSNMSAFVPCKATRRHWVNRLEKIKTKGLDSVLLHIPLCPESAYIRIIYIFRKDKSATVQAKTYPLSTRLEHIYFLI